MYKTRKLQTAIALSVLAILLSILGAVLALYEINTRPPIPTFDDHVNDAIQEANGHLSLNGALEVAALLEQARDIYHKQDSSDWQHGSDY